MKKWIKEQAKKRGLDGDFEVNVEIVSAEKMRELNKKFRQIDKATDVLSFPLYQNLAAIKKNKGPKILGDIFINKNDRERLEFLVKHGTNHLLGFHHK